MRHERCGKCHHYRVHINGVCTAVGCNCKDYRPIRRVKDLKNCCVCNKEFPIDKYTFSYTCSLECRRLANYGNTILGNLRRDFFDPIQQAKELGMIERIITYREII